jgi:hypothetical protein
MAFRSSFEQGRTWDEERGLELVVTIYRVAREYRIQKGEDVLVSISANISLRELSRHEKDLYPGFQKLIIWHINSFSSDANLLKYLKLDAMQLIKEAFTAYQGMNGVAGFKDRIPYYGLVDVRFDDPLPFADIY